MTSQPAFNNKTKPKIIEFNVTQQSLALAESHYENFPVGSIFLPRYLREPIALIYSFARQSDDFADEGDLSIEARLTLLNQFKDELDLLQAYIKPQTPFFATLGAMIKAKQLPYALFYDLLDAFSQDVIKTRYANYAEVLDYCRRSANPIGRLLLLLYGESSKQNNEHSDHICSALQIINFLQDIAIDFNKNDGKQRIYMCQDELQAFGISEQKLASFIANKNIAARNQKWQAFMQFNCQRVRAQLNSGKPLGYILKGRLGMEMRLVIAGGERIIQKIEAVNYDVFHRRPTLNKLDWCIIFSKALLKR